MIFNFPNILFILLFSNLSTLSFTFYVYKLHVESESRLNAQILDLLLANKNLLAKLAEKEETQTVADVVSVVSSPDAAMYSYICISFLVVGVLGSLAAFAGLYVDPQSKALDQLLFYAERTHSGVYYNKNVIDKLFYKTLSEDNVNSVVGSAIKNEVMPVVIEILKDLSST